MDQTWQKIKREILSAGLDGTSGLSVGLSRGQLRLADPLVNPVPEPAVPEEKLNLDPNCFAAAPEKGLPYPALNQFVFGGLPDSWLTGHIGQAFMGHAANEDIRSKGASGGVVTQVLLYLLKTGRISGAACVQLGKTKPYQPESVIARTPEQILACAQSVYTETPHLTILDQIANEPGPLAFVGLPDHVAAVRYLQSINHPGVRAIKYVLGPYTGTIMKFEAIKSYLKANGATLNQVASMNYRAGEWPGYLEIKLKSGRVLRAAKFYYNYLIPFFITSRSSRLAVDFTNELADISVGDAWAPAYEKQGGGWSVILGRTQPGVNLLQEMQTENILRVDPISNNQVIDMHSHMIDFKKRGSFIRMNWRKARGLPVPDFGYEPVNIPASRVRTEYIISGLFALGATPFARAVAEHIPISILGPAFNLLRKTWRRISKKQKRHGLRATKFRITA